MEKPCSWGPKERLWKRLSENVKFFNVRSQSFPDKLHDPPPSQDNYLCLVPYITSNNQRFERAGQDDTWCFWVKKGLCCPRYSQWGMLSSSKGVKYFLGHVLHLHLSSSPKPPKYSLFTLIFSSIWYCSRLKIVCDLTNQTLKIAVSAISSLNFLKLR